MKRINKLTLNNFKFFVGEESLDFDCKNILIYGENGSGKSSLYWALYTFINTPTNKYLEAFKYQNIKIILSIENGKYTKQSLIKPKIKVVISIIENGKDDIPIFRPQSYFNEAKLTAIALSVRLAITQVKLRDSPLKLLVLDDLLVSLDMSNRDEVLKEYYQQKL